MSRYPNVDFKTKPRCPLSLVPKKHRSPTCAHRQHSIPIHFSLSRSPTVNLGTQKWRQTRRGGGRAYASCPIILSERRWPGGDSLGYVPTRSVCRRQTQISSHGLPHCVTGSIQELFEVSVRAPPEAARTSLMAGMAKREHEGKNRGLF